MADDAGAWVEDTAQIGAARIRWQREGRGPAVVLLHGFPLSGETWRAVVVRLRERFTCYLPDLVGLGGSSSAVAEDYESPGQAKALSGLLSQQGVGSYALVGNDTGGWIARELALLDGPRVSRLVLTNTEIPFHRPPWIPTHQLLARVPGSGAVFRSLLGSAAFRRSPLAFGGCFFDRAQLEGEFHQRFVAPLIASPARMAGALQFLRRMRFARLDEFAQLHARLTLPTLFVWGADDPTFPVAKARAMVNQFPKPAGFHEVPRARLFVHEERPDEVAQHLLDFLAGAD